MSATVSSNFAFLSDQEPLLHQIATAAEASFYSDSNVTLVKLRQLTEHLTRNAAARLGIASGTDENFFSLIASLKSRIDLDEKVVRLLHHLRKSGNEAVHEYRHDPIEAGRALRSAREACIWYYRTFCSPHPGFKPGPFIKPRDWKQEEGDLRAEIARLEVELEKERNDSEKGRELVRSLKEQEGRLHAIVNERTLDAEASLALAEEQEKKLQSLAAEYEGRLAEIARRMQWDNNVAATISERSRQAGEHVQAEWAPEIRLRDAFDGHHLTANQESLVFELEAFLAARDEHVFILSGHAGTGKTFIIADSESGSVVLVTRRWHLPHNAATVRKRSASANLGERQFQRTGCWPAARNWSLVSETHSSFHESSQSHGSAPSRSSRVITRSRPV